MNIGTEEESISKFALKFQEKDIDEKGKRRQNVDESPADSLQRGIIAQQICQCLSVKEIMD